MSGFGFSLAVASQKVKATLQRSKKMDAMDDDFAALNDSLKDSRKVLSNLMAAVDAFEKTGTEFAAASSALMNTINDYIEERECADVLGEAFVKDFVSTQTRVLQLLDSTVKSIAGRARAPQEQLEEQLAQAKAAKLAAYDALHERNAFQAKMAGMSVATKKGMQLQQDFEQAVLNFSNRQRACMNAMEDVEQDIDWFFMELLCHVASVQRENVAAVAPDMDTLAADAAQASQVIAQKKQAWIFEQTLRQREMADLNTLASAYQGHTQSFEQIVAGLRPPVEPKPIAGEGILLRVPRVMNLVSGLPGVLLVTSYRLWFLPFTPTTREDYRGMDPSSLMVDSSTVPADVGFSIPLLSIARLEAVGDQHGLLVAWCHDLRSVRLGFAYATMSQQEVIDAAKPFLWPEAVDTLFALYHAKAKSGAAAFLASFGGAPTLGDVINPATVRNGWQLYHLPTEFKRQGASPTLFRISEANARYTLCSTYPSLSIVPANVTDELLRSAAPFRSKNRLPLIVWTHGEVSLSRSSQPLSGIFSSRSEPDEELVSALASRHRAPASVEIFVGRDVVGKSIAICDARPMVNAVGNKSRGGGVENVSRYRNAFLEYLGIDNIHVVREALVTLHNSVRAQASQMMEPTTNRTAQDIMESRVRPKSVIDAPDATAAATAAGAAASARSRSARQLKTGGRPVSMSFTRSSGTGDQIASNPLNLLAARNSADEASLRRRSIGHSLSSLPVSIDEAAPAAGSPAAHTPRARRMSEGSLSPDADALSPRSTVVSPSQVEASPPQAGASPAPAPVPATAPPAAAPPGAPPGAPPAAATNSTKDGVTIIRSRSAIVAQMRAHAGVAGPPTAAPPPPPGPSGGSPSGPPPATPPPAVPTAGATVPPPIPPMPPALPARVKPAPLSGQSGEASPSSSPLAVVNGSPPAAGDTEGEGDVSSSSAPQTPAAQPTSDGGAPEDAQPAADGGEQPEGEATNGPIARAVPPPMPPPGPVPGASPRPPASGPRPPAGPPPPLPVRPPKKADSGSDSEGEAETVMATGFDYGGAAALMPPGGSEESKSSSGGASGGSTVNDSLVIRRHVSARAAAISVAVVEQRPEWLRLISILLTGAVRVARLLSVSVPVLVHCSDGWDRTAQLTSLSQICLDPYFRTLRGFCILVEKEWCSFGYQFGRRCGTDIGPSRMNFNDDQRAPVFMQFLDAVWQIMRQFPKKFEFTETLLRVLADHVYSGRFGTFLFDCERIRVQHQLASKSVSVWTYIIEHETEFRNSLFQPARSAQIVEGVGIRASAELGEAIWPQATIEKLALWPLYIEQWLALSD